MSAIQLIVSMLVLVVGLTARLAQGKFDAKTGEVAIGLSLCLLCLWIKAFVGLTYAAYATYGAGKALRGWWEENHAQPQAEVAAQALQVAQVKVEKKILTGFNPVGLLPPSVEQVEVEKTIVGLLPPAVAQVEVEQVEVVSSPASGLEGLTVKQLKEVAKNRGMKGYSRLKKAELIKLLS